MEVSERKSNPEVSSLKKLQYYVESDFNEPPCRSQVGTGKKYQHFQTNLAKKKKCQKVPGKKTDDKRTYYAHLLKLWAYRALLKLHIVK